jgi:hypothetical protein
MTDSIQKRHTNFHVFAFINLSSAASSFIFAISVSIDRYSTTALHKMNENVIEKEESVGTEGITSVTSLPVVTPSPSPHDLSVDDKSNKTCLYLLYDERMTLHSPIG